MSGRKLLATPLEKHRQFAFALHELDRLSYDTVATAGMKNACDKLRYELGEHVFIEFTGLPEQKRFDVYYTALANFLEYECDLRHGMSVLNELIDSLEAANPQGKALHYSRKLHLACERFAAKQEARATQEDR